MRAGRLRHRLELQVPNEAAIGDAGNPDISYTADSTVWGSVEPVSVAERLAGQQVEAQATHLVTIRYHSGVAQTWRIKHGDHLYNIVSILNPDLRNIQLQILVREVPM